MKFQTRVFFGIHKETKEKVWLMLPKWECGWYWSFGYLEHKHMHYHLQGYPKKKHFFKLEDGSLKSITECRNKNMVDCLKEDYDLNPLLLKNIWQFCELALTAYALKETAEVLGRGGSHMTTNPCTSIIMNETEVTRINDVVLPAIFKEIKQIFEE